MKSISIPPELLEQCFAHGREAYPEEGCGVLSGPENEPEALESCHPLPNILNRMHEEDPGRYPRTAANGYLIDPAGLLRLEKDLAARGHKIKIIFHSHVDVGAYFSEEDVNRALWAGQPVMPGVSYLVCGVKDGQPDGAILAYFGEEVGTFLTLPVQS